MFFIVGRGRSGTDLLSRILNTHPEICVPPESSLVTFLAHKYGNRDLSSERAKKAFCKDIFKEQKIHYWWKLDEYDLSEFLIKQDFCNYADAIGFVFRFYAQKNNKSQAIYLGDKDPAHTLYLDTLIRIFPQAKFIALVRDPVDNVNSFLNVDFDSNNINTLASRWVLYNQSMLEFMQGYESNVLKVFYEDLVTVPQEVLSRISDFLGVSYNYSLEMDSVQIKGKWQENLASPISGKQIGRGRRELDESKQQQIMTYCYETAKALGYSLENRPEHLHSPKLFSRAATLFERVLFKMPLTVSAKVLRFYRNKTGAFKEQS